LQLDVPQTTVCRVIQSTDNKTFWITLAYTARNFILFFSGLKITGYGNTDNNLESPRVF
jgi:hypothetical protein